MIAQPIAAEHDVSPRPLVPPGGDAAVPSTRRSTLNVSPRLFAPIAAAPDSLPSSIESLVEDLWSRIQNGLNGRWPPWALPMLATHSREGPRARVLALRSIDPGERRFVFHTDARSAKIGELESDSRVSLVFWDPHDVIEARFSGIATLHCADDIAADAWQNVSPLRRLASSITLPPAASLARTSRFDSLAAIEDNDVAFRHFTVVHVTVTDLDWLWLGPGDMRRAMIRWADGECSGTWVVP